MNKNNPSSLFQRWRGFQATHNTHQHTANLQYPNHHRGDPEISCACARMDDLRNKIQGLITTTNEWQAPSTFVNIVFSSCLTCMTGNWEDRRKDKQFVFLSEINLLLKSEHQAELTRIFFATIEIRTQQFALSDSIELPSNHCSYKRGGQQRHIHVFSESFSAESLIHSRFSSCVVLFNGYTLLPYRSSTQTIWCIMPISWRNL